MRAIKVIALGWSVVLLYSQTAHAQGAGTVGGLIVGVQAVENALNETVANAGTEGRSVVNSANGTLNGTLDQLKSLVNGNLGQQVSQLTGTAQSLATQLQNTVDNLNQVLAIREQCGVDDLQRLVYGVKTVTSQLQNAIPFIKGSQPYLYSFVFDGHHASIVPAAGGRLSIEGSNLWPSGVAPKVTLVDGTTRKPIEMLNAGSASSTDAVSVVLDPATIAAQAGQCPEFEVVPQKKTGWWVFGQQEDIQAMYLPVCIPRSLTTTVRVRVSSSFQCPTTSAPTPLQSQEFRCDNSSCENTGGCNQQKSWAIPSGCTVVGTQKTPGLFMKNASQDTVPVSNVGGNYTAAGTIPTATCLAVGGGLLPSFTKLEHPSIWDVNVVPVVQCTSTPWLPAADAVSVPKPVTADTVPICASVTPSCTNPQSSTYEASLELLDTSPVQGTSTSAQPITLVTTNKVTATGTATQQFNNMQYQGIQFQGAVNPVAGGQAQVCTTVTMPQCGY